MRPSRALGHHVNEHIVVTGAAGFIGRHVVRTLLERGAEVVGIDRQPYATAPREQQIRCDLSVGSPAVRRALAAADGVIHLAGRPGVRDQDPRADALRHRDNVVVGRNVLAWTPPDVAMVVASSSSVYGGTVDDRPSAETDQLSPRGGYARSKAELERCCEERRASGGHVGVVRPFTVAGEGQRPDMAFSRWIADLVAGRPLTVLGDPQRRRDVTDVRSVAEGIVRMLERRVADTVNLGTGVSHTLQELVTAVAGVVGTGASVEVVPAHPDEAPFTRADVRRCRTLLGFVPTTDLADLIARQAAATSPRDTVLSDHATSPAVLVTAQGW